MHTYAYAYYFDYRRKADGSSQGVDRHPGKNCVGKGRADGADRQRNRQAACCSWRHTAKVIGHSEKAFFLVVLADTSIWIEHFRHGRTELSGNLTEGLVLMHPFVIGELACGNLKDRGAILSMLHSLPAAGVASHDEVLEFMERYKLGGKGLGWIDVHLLASVLLSNCRFWTLDRRLAKVASDLGLV